MKKIAVIGLGIIGGSISGALTKAGYTVDGFDKNEASLRLALDAGYVRAIGEDTAQYDVVFIALPPQATTEQHAAIARTAEQIVAKNFFITKVSLYNNVFKERYYCMLIFA